MPGLIEIPDGIYITVSPSTLVGNECSDASFSSPNFSLKKVEAVSTVMIEETKLVLAVVFEDSGNPSFLQLQNKVEVRKINKTVSNFAEKLRRSCGEVAEKLRRSCGEVAAKLRRFRNTSHF
jgi:transcriptional regulator of heat shock response